MYFQTIAVFSILLFNGGLCLELHAFYNYLQDNSSSSSPECATQKSAFLRGLIKNDAWATRMLDAYGRIPQGFAQGNFIDLGMFDQCLNIAEKVDDIDIKGKYCYNGLIIPFINLNPSTLQVNQIITRGPDEFSLPRTTLTAGDSEISIQNFALLAVCVPDACSPSDLFGPLGTDFSCQTKNETKKLDAADIASLCFFSIIALLLILSTIYDYYLHQTSKEPSHAILLAFSVYTNGKKLLKTNQDSGQILFLNGMKVLSMFWVIMGHRYSGLEGSASNKEEMAAWRENWYAVYALVAQLSVDSFLYISGVLLAYTFLKTMRKPNQKFNIALYYLHRYLRLTPALAVLYIFQVTLARRIYDGPMHPVITMTYNYDACVNSNWWSFFLYIQNYVATNNMCLLHTWYLSVDMQFYVISPLLLLPMHYFGKRVTYIVLPILVLVSITYNMFLFYFYDIALWTEDYHNLYYYVTHTRFPPWFIGLMFGAFLLDYQSNNRKYQIKNKFIVLAMWGITFCLIGFVCFYQNDAYKNHTTIKATLFFPLQRPLWALCLCWISYACLSGNAGIVNSFLSIPTFQILSKITYSAYLLHFVIQLLLGGFARTTPYFTEIEAVRMVIADTVMSYLLGAVWTLAFESPILVLEKILFRREDKSKATDELKMDEISNTK